MREGHYGEEGAKVDLSPSSLSHSIRPGLFFHALPPEKADLMRAYRPARRGSYSPSSSCMHSRSTLSRAVKLLYGNSIWATDEMTWRRPSPAAFREWPRHTGPSDNTFVPLRSRQPRLAREKESAAAEREEGALLFPLPSRPTSAIWSNGDNREGRKEIAKRKVLSTKEESAILRAMCISNTEWQGESAQRFEDRRMLRSRRRSRSRRPRPASSMLVVALLAPAGCDCPFRFDRVRALHFRFDRAFFPYPDSGCGRASCERGSHCGRVSCRGRCSYFYCAFCNHRGHHH